MHVSLRTIPWSSWSSTYVGYVQQIWMHVDVCSILVRVRMCVVSIICDVYVMCISCCVYVHACLCAVCGRLMFSCACFITMSKLWAVRRFDNVGLTTRHYECTTRQNMHIRTWMRMRKRNRQWIKSVSRTSLVCIKGCCINSVNKHMPASVLVKQCT